ncbi:NAD(P)/FAD-dependent oxidoreductase [Candidatus Micrarchaeota archaeon]|nr:NAD(P)/FAD-dependent oxidoreductase [Candidatus Micrarchaeota archaeon]
MDPRNKNVVVIGASAVGSLSAKYVSDKGLDVTLLEEDAKAGKFNRCGGIFSKEGMDQTGVPYRRILLNEVKGARILSRKKEMRIKSSSVKGVVLDRQQFDELCADQAVSSGAHLLLNHRVTDYSSNGSMKALTTHGTFSSKVMIAADGVGSLAAKKWQLPPFKTSDLVLSYQAEFENANVPDREMVDVLLDTDAYKHFFAWTIPVNEERIRVGVATTDMAQIHKARKAVFSHPAIADQIEGARKTFDFHYTIPLRYRKQTQKRFGKAYGLLVGDAAGQVKATTGGGVIFGSKCARALAEEATAFLSNEKETLEYESCWRAQHGRILDVHYGLHRTYRLFNSSLTDFALQIGNTLQLNRVFEKRGDMDFILK